MVTVPEINRYIAFDGNPFFRIRQNTKGSLFGIFLDPKFDSKGQLIPSKDSMQFHVSREGTEYHLKYKYGKRDWRKTDIRNLPQIQALNQEEKFCEFVLTDTTAHRVRIENRTYPTMLDLNPKKYASFTNIKILLNAQTQYYSNSIQDVCIDNGFVKPITVIAKRLFPPLKGAIEIMI